MEIEWLALGIGFCLGILTGGIMSNPEKSRSLLSNIKKKLFSWIR